MEILDKKSLYWEMAQKLIAFDTVSNKSNSPCAALIAGELESLGFHVVIDEYIDSAGVSKQQVIAKIGPEVEGGLLLSGHIDTVPFERQAGWTKDALKLLDEDNKLYGRGTCDMKLFIASCMEAFRLVDLKKLKKPIVCAFTADEEVGCLGAKNLVSTLKRLLEKTPLPKMAIIGEPTSFKMINRHKGVGHFQLDLQGKAWHSSRPDLGVNAIEPAGKVLRIIQELNQQYETSFSENMRDEFPDFPQNYLHVATIEGGLALNMVPEKASIGLSYRLFPNDSPMKVYEDFKQILESELSAESFTLSAASTTPAMPTGKSKELEQCIGDVCGHYDTHSVSFATDGGYFAQLGIDCYIWGPGTIEMAHRSDEYMPTEDFIKAPLYLEKIINNLLT